MLAAVGWRVAYASIKWRVTAFKGTCALMAGLNTYKQLPNNSTTSHLSPATSHQNK
jgi:hypothetical protein